MGSFSFTLLPSTCLKFPFLKILFHDVQSTDCRKRVRLFKGIPLQFIAKMLQQRSGDEAENVKENKAINSGAVHLKRSKAFQNTNSGSQLATGFPKMDPHNTPELPVEISTPQKHVPKSKEAE